MIQILVIILSAAVAQEYRTDLVSHPNWNLISSYQDDCGESVADRIIGGVNASLGQYPWIARLGYTYEEDSDQVEVDMYECGGAIITDRYILTAAHCSPGDLEIRMVQVRLGEYYTETDPDCVNGVCAPPVQDIAVENYTCHQEFNDKTLYHDICLIRLAKPIQFNNFVQTICLPVYDTFQKTNFEKTVMEVAGWGLYDVSVGKGHTILQTLKLSITNQDECNRTYLGKTVIHDTQFCAGGVVGQDSCSGDSGGPIMTPFTFNAPPKYYLLGIVSFGRRKCAATTAPGVYTKVSAYMKWILDTMKP